MVLHDVIISQDPKKITQMRPPDSRTEKKKKPKQAAQQLLAKLSEGRKMSPDSPAIILRKTLNMLTSLGGDLPCDYWASFPH